MEKVWWTELKGHILAFYDDGYNAHTLIDNYQTGYNVQRVWHSQNLGTNYNQMSNFPNYYMRTSPSRWHPIYCTYRNDWQLCGLCPRSFIITQLCATDIAGAALPPQHISSPSVFRTSSCSIFSFLCSAFVWWLLALFLLVIVLSILSRFTASDNPFVIFELLSTYSSASCIFIENNWIKFFFSFENHILSLFIIFKFQHLLIIICIISKKILFPHTFKDLIFCCVWITTF